MADKTRSDSEAARSKRGTLSVKTKRKQPFVLESFLSHADGGRTKAKYRKNEIIFRQGDSADAVFYIMDGKCKVTVVSEKGKEAVVALHEKGDFFGEGCLNGHSRRLATVTATTESEIMRLDKATMVRVLHTNRSFRSCSYRISSLGMSALKRTWSISCSIRARSAWRGCFC